MVFVGNDDAANSKDVVSLEDPFCTFYCNMVFIDCLRHEHCKPDETSEMCINELDSCIRNCRHLAESLRNTRGLH